MKKIALFDLDGTLTIPRQKASFEILNFLERLRTFVFVGIVSGSDLTKVNEQLGCDSVKCMDFVFSENGLVAYKNGACIGTSSIANFLGEHRLQELLNFVMKYFSDIILPVKRGTFIEYRTGMLNLSPIGRACSQQERLDFFAYDRIHKVRESFVKALGERFPKDVYQLQFSIGGQISVDCFPVGWDKTYCLNYLPNDAEIHFFGDMTHPGGNDHEIFEHERVTGHTVIDPEDTMRQVCEIFDFERIRE